MRLGLSRPTGESLDHWLALFQTALTEAQRVAGEWRDSGLAHILSISGMHMGLLTAFVFAAVRYGLAAVWPVDDSKVRSLTLLVVGVIAGVSGGPLAAAGAVAAAVVLGFITIAWRDRWARGGRDRPREPRG